MFDPTMETEMRARMERGDFSQWMGLELVSLGDGTSEVRLSLQPHHLNPGGIAHGGVIASMLDVAIGLAHRTQLGWDATHVTIQLQINYLRAVGSGVITARGTAVHSGRRTGYGEATLYDDKDRAVARATGTFLVLPTGLRPPETGALDGE